MNIQLFLVMSGLVVSVIVIPTTQVLQSHLQAAHTTKRRAGACVVYAMFTMTVISASSYVTFVALWALGLRA